MKTELEEDDAILNGLLKASGKQAAFRLLLNKYQQKLYWFIRKMIVSHEDTDEQLQQLFIKFWKHIPDLSTNDSIPVLLYRMASDACLQFLSKQPERERQEFFKRKFNGGKEQRGLQLALLELTDQQKLIFILKQAEGFDYKTIAEIVGMPLAQIKDSFNKAAQRSFKGN